MKDMETMENLTATLYQREEKFRSGWDYCAFISFSPRAEASNQSRVGLRALEVASWLPILGWVSNENVKTCHTISIIGISDFAPPPVLPISTPGTIPSASEAVLSH